MQNGRGVKEKEKGSPTGDSPGKSDLEVFKTVLYNALHGGFRRSLLEQHKENNRKVWFLPKFGHDWNLQSVEHNFKLFKLLRENISIDANGTPQFHEAFQKRLRTDARLLSIHIMICDDKPSLYHSTSPDGLCFLRRAYQHEMSKGNIDATGAFDPDLNNEQQRQSFVQYLRQLPQRKGTATPCPTIDRAPEVADWIIREYETEPVVAEPKLLPQSMWGDRY
jgi:hypothetical protein